MKDSTLGGYLREHERPPAFQGSDGHAYTVEIMVDETSATDAGTRGVYLFFLRWRGNEPVGHLETGFLSHGRSDEEARAAVERLTLHEVKALLDGLIGR